jgi:inhibitor of cysteine peptidase
MRRQREYFHVMPKTYRADSDIVAGVGEPFVIELESNPTTGYEWQLQVDPNKVEIINRKYQSSGSGIGAGGSEQITLRPISSGDTSIRALYKRNWETNPIKERHFKLRVRA